MFRRVLVGEPEGLINVVDLDDQTLFDGLPDDVHTRQRVGLTIDLLLDVFEQFQGEVDGDQDNLRVDTVFGLGEKIGRNKDRVGSLVGNDLERCRKRTF